MSEQPNAVTFKGQPLTLVGDILSLGQPAPDATLVANDMSEIGLVDYRDKISLISAVPSLDTPVCDQQTRRFNEAASDFGEKVVVLTVSMDLPFAQKRWCGAAGVDHVVTLSDHRLASFGRAHGVLIKELRLLARSIFVVDTGGVIRHLEIVPEMTEHPDYDAALAAVGGLTG